MDNCCAHPEELKSSDGSITGMFLTPNKTSLIQPMDQGILQAAKNRYKRKLLQRVITNQDAETTQSLKEIKKKLTVKESIYMLADAWEEASAESIFKAFSKLQIHPDAETRLNNSEMQMQSVVSESMMEIVNEVGNS
ncbi:jerky protein homolog-like [Montipora foliosa]|uniref:jerky protein homolog-like n=1 Tax=Montipora foliosa TaxID=591990 RepID=UPI0035F162B7